MKRLVINVAFILLFGGWPWLPTSEAETGPEYRVTVSEQNKRLAIVEARFSPKSETILMYPEGATRLPDGWATFVRSLVAKTNAGAADTTSLSWAGTLAGSGSITGEHQFEL